MGRQIHPAWRRIGFLSSVAWYAYAACFFPSLRWGLYARRTHENDGVFDSILIKAALRLHVLRQNSQHTGILAIQERLVAVRFNETSQPFTHGFAPFLLWSLTGCGAS